MKICTSGWSILKSSKQVQSFILEIESKQFAYKQTNKQQNHPMTITDFALSILERKLNLLLRILHLYSTSQAIIAQSSLERISGLFSLASIVIISFILNFGQDKALTCFASDQISHSVVSVSLQPHELQYARPPCPSPTPGVHPDSRPSGQ